jgi:hypothetical protein
MTRASPIRLMILRGPNRRCSRGILITSLCYLGMVCGSLERTGGAGMLTVRGGGVQWFETESPI